jgi:hypothetical protein
LENLKVGDRICQIINLNTSVNKQVAESYINKQIRAKIFRNSVENLAKNIPTIAIIRIPAGSKATPVRTRPTDDKDLNAFIIPRDSVYECVHQEICEPEITFVALSKHKTPVRFYISQS